MVFSVVPSPRYPAGEIRPRAIRGTPKWNFSTDSRGPDRCDNNDAIKPAAARRTLHESELTNLRRVRRVPPRPVAQQSSLASLVASLSQFRFCSSVRSFPCSLPILPLLALKTPLRCSAW